MTKAAETQVQLWTRLRDRRREVTQGETRPYFGVLKAYNSEEDSSLLDSHGGRRVISNPQPHLGQTAWIRAAPDPGMGSLLITRSDAREPEIMRWWDTDTRQRLLQFRESVENVLSGTNQLARREAYRPIQAGELDFASRGGAQIFFGSRPHVDLRAGVVQLTMDQDETEFATKSPVHVRRSYQHASDRLRDEERFGVIKRSKQGKFTDQFYPDPRGRTPRQSFGKEYLLRLTNSEASLPEHLLDFRHGHVLDDLGDPVRLEETGLQLRSRSQFYTRTGSAVQSEVDESGNFKIAHPSDATYGGLFTLPKGTMRARIGVDFTEDIGRNSSTRVGRDHTVNVGNNQSISVSANRSDKVTVNETRFVGSKRTDRVGGREERSIGEHGVEKISGSKAVSVGQELLIQVGSGNMFIMTGEGTGFQAKTLSISASGEVTIKAPVLNLDVKTLNVSGVVRAQGGFRSNATNISPNGRRGKAGPIPKGTVLTSSSAKSLL